MLCEKILGKTSDDEFKDKKVDYVEIEWHETYNKILRKTSRDGRDVAIRLGDEILKIGMKPEDVLGVDDDGTVVAVDVPPVKIIAAEILEPSPFNFAKIGYEIGNCHAPLFAGKYANEFITIYNEPMEHLLNHLKFVKTEIRTEKLDFSKQISTIVGHGHHHHEDESHHEE